MTSRTLARKVFTTGCYMYNIIIITEIGNYYYNTAAVQVKAVTIKY